ncbi:MAG: ATP-binding protein [Pseudomonadota bacterium]
MTEHQRGQVVWWRSIWGSLFGRLGVILFCGLAAAHALTLFWVFFERGQLGRSMMLSYMGRDIAASVAILDRVPPAERAAWLPRIERQDYRYILAAPTSVQTPAQHEESDLARVVRQSVTAVVGVSRVGSQASVQAHKSGERIEMGLLLEDGSPVTLQWDRPHMRISTATASFLSLQLLMLGLVTWLAVRAAVRPLKRLADAADGLDLNRSAPALSETGPAEVARAAHAFNAMRARIADHLAERLRILAAVSHDLQTPITRMRLRVEMLDSGPVRDKLQSDLTDLQALVEDGVAYARSAQANSETPRAADINALLDALVCDYVDAGHAVHLAGVAPVPWQVRPLALKRLVTNLLDNAVKFAGGAELVIEQLQPDTLDIVVCDNGPGIAEAELQAVMQPFYRVESSRNRESGGAGLGLAIAQELAGALDASLSLSNRPSGGLEARLRLSRVGMG